MVNGTCESNSKYEKEPNADGTCDKGYRLGPNGKKCLAGPKPQQ